METFIDSLLAQNKGWRVGATKGAPRFNAIPKKRHNGVVQK